MRVPPDDALTLVAIGVLAFVVADVAHEAIGHGLAILVSGAVPVQLTSCYFSSSGHWSKWIAAGGGVANVVAGLIALFFIQRVSGSHVRYFLILTLAFNLLFAAAYPAYSGLAMFGDWAAVIEGLSPAWLWRALLIAFSVVSYYLSLRLIAAEIGRFRESGLEVWLPRLRRITLVPYVAAMVIACVAGAFNPMGWKTMLTSALPAAAAAFGITQMDQFQSVCIGNTSVSAGPIGRSWGWMAAALIVAIGFVAVLGRGVRFSG